MASRDSYGPKTSRAKKPKKRMKTPSMKRLAWKAFLSRLTRERTRSSRKTITPSRTNKRTTPALFQPKTATP
jgi:hypothetical protein